MEHSRLNARKKIWLKSVSGPISSSYGSNGKPVPIASTNVDGTTFELYSGPNGDTTVYSFVASNEVTNFNGDIYSFFKYLISEGHISSSQYLTSVGAGTEPYVTAPLNLNIISRTRADKLSRFTGSNANFQTKAYSMSIA